MELLEPLNDTAEACTIYECDGMLLYVTLGFSDQMTESHHLTVRLSPGLGRENMTIRDSLYLLI